MHRSYNTIQSKTVLPYTLLLLLRKTFYLLATSAEPVLVDEVPGTYNIDANQIEAAVGSKAKSIMLPQSLCNLFNLVLFMALCKK